MMTKSNMMEPLLGACPSFGAEWEAFCADWAQEPGEPPLYVALGDLALHVVRQLEEGETAGFPRVFAVVERWHLEGDHYVREAATVGFLEGVQGAMGNRGLDPSVIERWLLPESKKWWDRLNRFWNGDAGALREE